MQATGVYWTALYDVLESYGLEVNVAHAQHTKTLPGRKTDVQECQWLQKLHTFGLLNKAFRPAEEIRVLRSYLRQRENLVAAAAMCVQHMQKALTEMNIQLANVISDISGTTGMAILRDIVRGERDPEKLARHKHARIRASQQEIARSLAAQLDNNFNHHCGGGEHATTPCDFASHFASATDFGQQRRNQLYGPNYTDFDLDLSKSFKIVPKWESARLKVAAQFFNTFNHPNFQIPFADVNNSSSGFIYTAASTPTSVLGAFLGGDASPRLIQLKGTFVF